MKVCVSGDDQHAWGPSAGNRADPRDARQHAGAHEPRMDLIKKLGHPLSEVRVRAARSVLTKFDGNIVGWRVEELAAERTFLANFLAAVVNWFNDAPPGSLQREMLGLVATFAAVRSPAALARPPARPLIHLCIVCLEVRLAHSSNTGGAQYPASSAPLVDLGSIPFFQAYQHDAPQELHAGVQDIIDNLLKVQVDPSPVMTPDVSPMRKHPAATAVATAPTQSAPLPNVALCARIARHCRTPAADGVRFPHVQLSAEDDAYLSELTIRLYRQVPREAIDACTELQHAVALDFPAEVVIQRPALFQSILSLVQSPNSIGELAVDLAAITALKTLVHSFKDSLRAYGDANLTSSALFGSAGPSHRGSLQQSASADMGTEKVPSYPVGQALLAEGLSLPQACRCIIGEILPLLRDARRVAAICSLAKDILPLLSFPSSSGKHSDSATAVETCMITDYLHAVSKVLQFHGEAAVTDPLLSHIIDLGLSIMELVPPSELQTDRAWPEHLVALVSDLLLNEGFCADHPKFRSRITPYLTVLRPLAIERFTKALSVRQQIEKCISLFHRERPFQLEDINVVVDASHALHYCSNSLIVDKFVRVCANLAAAEGASETQLVAVRQILVNALASDVVALRVRTYAALNELFMEAKQRTGSACGPNSVPMALIAGKKLFTQLTNCGLHDDHVSTAAAELLLSITTLCDPPNLSSMVLPSIAGLQAAVGASRAGSVASGLLDVVHSHLHPLAKLKVNLRWLFHAQTWCRKRAAFALNPRATRHEQTLEHYDTDPFEVQEPDFGFDRLANLPRAPSFNKAQVSKVITIFTQSTLTSQLRRSAAEQLVVLCRDSRVCNILWDHQVWNALWSELATDSNLHELCLTLISSIVEQLPEAHAELDSWANVQRLLPFVFHSSGAIRAVTSRLVAVLCFASDQTVSTPYKVSKRLRLPTIFCNNFRFCFPVEAINTSTKAPLDSDLDSTVAQWLEGACGEANDPRRVVPCVVRTLQGLGLSTGHIEALGHLDALQHLCTVSESALQAVLDIDWMACCERYLRVVPKSQTDYKVVSKVMEFVSLMMCNGQVDAQQLQLLQARIEATVNLLGAFSSAEETKNEQVSSGWSNAAIRRDSGPILSDSRRDVMDTFREAALSFIAAFLSCEQRASTKSGGTAKVLVDATPFLSILCTPGFPGRGQRAFGIRAAALRCLNLVLPGVLYVNNTSEVSKCFEFCRQVSKEGTFVAHRFVDNSLYQMALHGVGHCCGILHSLSAEASQDVIASSLELVQKRDTTTRAAVVHLPHRILRNFLSRPHHIKLELQKFACAVGLGHKMLSIFLDHRERCVVRAEAICVLTEAIRCEMELSPRMPASSAANDTFDEQISSTRHIDCRELIRHCLQLLASLLPPAFAGRICDYLLWSALTVGEESLEIIREESAWLPLLQYIPLSNHWLAYSIWQQGNGVAAICGATREMWLISNANDLAAASSSFLRLMRAMILADAGTSFMAAGLLDEFVKDVVHLLADVLHAPEFDDDSFAAVHQPAYELLSCLLVTLDGEEALLFRNALGAAIGETVRLDGETNGSAMADSLTLCVQSAISTLEIAACQFVDVLLTNGPDLLLLHMSSSQCEELAAALTAAYIQGPSRDKVGNSCTDCALWTCSVRGALGQLLAWSHDAKMAAMDANLLQATVGALQSLHETARLKLLAPEDESECAMTRAGAFVDISAELRLIKNLLFHSPKAKEIAAGKLCLRILRALWTLLLEQPEPHCTVQLLHVCADMVSHSDVAQAWWDGRLLPTEHNGDARYILSCAMRLARKRQLQSPIWLAAVGVLRNFAVIKAARLYMLKEGWLNQCATLLQGIAGRARSKEHPRAEALCAFLANFTFATDGQAGCLKATGMLSILLATLNIPSMDVQRSAMLTLRNLCFLRSNKAHFLANRDALPAIGRALAQGDDHLRLHAASAIWALVYDNQKAKAAVKAQIGRGDICLDFPSDCLTSSATTVVRAARHAVLQARQILFT